MVRELPRILKMADTVATACIGLSQHLVVLHRDLRRRTGTHLIFIQNRHAYLDAVLSDLQGLLHLVEDELLVRDAAGPLGLERLQEAVQIVVLLALILASLLLCLHGVRLAALLLVLVQRALLLYLLRGLIRVLDLKL